MAYHWTLNQESQELVKFLAARLATQQQHVTHSVHVTHNHVAAAIDAPTLVDIAGRLPSGGASASLELGEDERLQLIREFESVIAYLERESNNFAFVPTPHNPSADFWDLFANTQALESSLTALEPQP